MPRSAKFWIILAAILLGATGLYLLGAHRVPLWDRDEPWYAQCTREMLQSGDWVVPKFLGAWRLEKPPFIYWCQLFAMKIEGETPEAVRFPSTVAVVLAGLIAGIVVRRFTGNRRAIWTVFIFCTCGLAIASAKFAITDAMMLLFVIMGQACLAVLYAASRRERKSPFWAVPIFWMSLGCAGLTKGPQAIGMHLLTMILLSLMDAGIVGFSSPGSWRNSIRWWKRLQPLYGLPLLILVVAPWLIMIRHRAPGFAEALLLKAKAHSGSSMDGHGEPPGYHMLLIFGTFFPWSVLLPTVVTFAWRNRRLDAIRFAMAATAGPWLLMECVWTKLPFYVLPAFPGLAFLTADALVRCIRGQYTDLKRPIFLGACTIWVVATLGLSVAPWLALGPSRAEHLPVPIIGMIAFTVAGFLYAALVFLRFAQHRIARAAVVMGVGMAIMLAILYVAILPGMKIIQLSERVGADLKTLGAYGPEVRVDMIGYNEPGVAFYQGGGARQVLKDYLQSTPVAQWPRWIVIGQDEWNDVPPNLRKNLTIRATEWGINYAFKGLKETVLIAEKNRDAQ